MFAAFKIDVFYRLQNMKMMSQAATTNILQLK